MRPAININSLMILAMVFVAIACPAAEAIDAQSVEVQRLEFDGTTMGTVTWSVVAYADPDQSADIQATIERSLSNVNDRMSTYKPDSEVSRFNTSQSTDWFDVSIDTVRVVQRAQEISLECDGAFDITIAPLVNLWKFGPDKSEFVVPDDATIDAMLKTIGFRKLSVRDNPPGLKKAIPELQIDLSAIAKGYAVDEVANALLPLKVENFLVEVGGEVRAAGEKPDNESWTVGIEKPVAGERDVYSVIELYHKSLASSGDYRNFYEVDGKRYSHTIDPRTGRPVQGGPAAASVVAADCMTADAVATTVMVLGKNGGLELGRELGVEVLVLSPDYNRPGLFLAAQTEGFPANKQQENEVAGVEAIDISFWRTLTVASIFFAIAIVAMSVGVILGRQRLRGSCGGLATLDDPDADPSCSLCSAPSKECRELKKAVRNKQQDATSGNS